ncbi:SAM hydroxide adenosyltransferase [Adhaeretor mobilis]|uniref:S-adenosyl-l-methionine hydroxide adenosyltransferase n=1 Tax=Adhaeretor mobilis TaxID=1930276 RepID=A0A517MXR5_9BACT|nr:SAM hydroxide adenosyltransferase [Adhaeretor mobilis]QDS99672.1 S-adenosyl-l-methionine hydroxide adenosyltransferase [Adhaeretor mobilis]
MGATTVANKITGSIQSIDAQGNLVTNISSEQLEGVPRDDSVGVFCDGHETRGIFPANHDQPPMTLIAVIGSSSCIELAIVEDSARIMLGVSPGEAVEVKW